jgi:hypothetical protein
MGYLHICEHMRRHVYTETINLSSCGLNSMSILFRVRITCEPGCSQHRWCTGQSNLYAGAVGNWKGSSPYALFLLNIWYGRVMCVEGYPQQHFTQLGGRADFYNLLFGIVYLVWCDFAKDPTKEHQILRSSRKRGAGDPGNDQTSVRERKHEQYTESPDSLRPKRQGRWRRESRACSSLSLTSRGLLTKKPSWQAKQSIPHTTVTFCGDCLRIC